MILTEISKCSEQSLSQCHFVHNKFDVDRPEIEPRSPRTDRSSSTASHLTHASNVMFRLSASTLQKTYFVSMTGLNIAQS
jgi:hypothetical protein